MRMSKKQTTNLKENDAAKTLDRDYNHHYKHKLKLIEIFIQFDVTELVNGMKNALLFLNRIKISVSVSMQEKKGQKNSEYSLYSTVVKVIRHCRE